MIIKKLKYLAVIFNLLFGLFIISANADGDIEALLSKGKIAIENDKYQEAVNQLGEILTASGNESNDPRIVAFGATVQAYGIWKLNKPEMMPMVKQYLEKAITEDPGWEFPKELLKKLR